jgi:hypothetical protein
MTHIAALGIPYIYTYMHRPSHTHTTHGLCTACLQDSDVRSTSGLSNVYRCVDRVHPRTATALWDKGFVSSSPHRPRPLHPSTPSPRDWPHTAATVPGPTAATALSPPCPGTTSG